MSFPLLFTLPPSSRHELILLDPSSVTLKALNRQITATIAASPNCAEFMAQHKKQGEKEVIQEFKVHWDTKTRDSKIWPEYTIITEENLAAVVEMLRSNGGRDVLEVRVGKAE